MSPPRRPPEPSPQALRAVAAFRRRGQLPDGAKDALRARIDASLAARSEVQPPIDIARSAWRIGVVMTAAAGVLLALRMVGSSGTLSQRTAPSSDQASYEATPPDPDQGQARLRTPSRDSAPEDSTPASDTAPPPSTEPASVSPPKTPPAPRAPASTRSAQSDLAPTAEADLAAELAVMRQARAALREQDPLRALRLLDEHAARFASGQMLEDRQALRVQALCDAGHGDRAREAARRFAREHAGSPHVARVTTICIEP